MEHKTVWGGVLDWTTVSGILLGGRLRRLLEGKGPEKGKGKSNKMGTYMQSRTGKEQGIRDK